MNGFKQEKKNFQCLWEVTGLGQPARNFFPLQHQQLFAEGYINDKILTTAFQKVKSNLVFIISY